MRKIIVGFAVMAAVGFAASGALAQSAMKSSMASHSAMASSAGHTTKTKMDVMMVNNCLAMPHKKMVKDAECKDYMKHHPDWMKRK